MRFGSRKSGPSLSLECVSPSSLLYLGFTLDGNRCRFYLIVPPSRERARAPENFLLLFLREYSRTGEREEGGMRIKLNCVRRPRAHTHTFRAQCERESEILLQIYGWISWPRISVTETCENETSLRERVKSSVNLAFAMEMRIHYFESERKK
jgi:hypothetical protein